MSKEAVSICGAVIKQSVLYLYVICIVYSPFCTLMNYVVHTVLYIAHIKFLRIWQMVSAGHLFVHSRLHSISHLSIYRRHLEFTRIERYQL